MTHCRSENVELRSCWMLGSATFTIVMSSSSMKVPRQTAASVHHFGSLEVRLSVVVAAVTSASCPTWRAPLLEARHCPVAVGLGCRREVNDVNLPLTASRAGYGGRGVPSLAPFAVRRRRAVLAATFLFVVASIVLGSGVVKRLSGAGFDDPAAASTRAAGTIAREFHTGTPDFVL